MNQWITDNAKTVPLILVGTAIYAFGLQFFIIPNQLLEGGVTGVGILLNYAFQVPLSWSILVLNIPLFITGWRILGREQVLHAIIGTGAVTFFLYVMERLVARGIIIPFATKDDYILAALYAGVTCGLGLGIVFRYGGNTGGVDIIARIMVKLRGSSIGQVILIVDAVILLLGLLYLPIAKVLYTLVAIFVATRVLDFVQEGAYAARAFQIFTWKSAELAPLIAERMERGVTLFHGQGVHSGKQMDIIYCVVARSEMRKLHTLVRSLDPHAFIVVTNVHDVLGEGFKPE